MAVRWITDREVVESLTLYRCMDYIERALAREAVGAAKTMPKTHISYGDGNTLHAIGGVDGDLVGTKTWAHTLGGANPLLILWDSETGQRRAVIEAFALGQLRTAAMSGLATRILADPTTDTVAVIGTGKQSLPQVSALMTVLPLKLVRIYGRDPVQRQKIVDTVDGEIGVRAVGATSVEEAVEGAGVITTATRATEPFLRAAAVSTGAHINAIGAITPERAELFPDLVARSFVVTDNIESARALGAEVRDAELVALSSMIGAKRPEADVTLFKAMGIGLADIALGRAVLEAE